eukprot:m.92375 g.92375  ORF g.92375 m.92375 type:complete len:224 (+) comp14942_c0_seq2:78-749(+)
MAFDDCRYFLLGSCTKGANCIFRHFEPARSATTVCEAWQQQKCSNMQCPLRHSAIPSQVVCCFESTPTGCTKPNCPYLHTVPKHTAPAAPVTTSPRHHGATSASITQRQQQPFPTTAPLRSAPRADLRQTLSSQAVPAVSGGDLRQTLTKTQSPPTKPRPSSGKVSVLSRLGEEGDQRKRSKQAEQSTKQRLLAAKRSQLLKQQQQQQQLQAIMFTLATANVL